MTTPLTVHLPFNRDILGPAFTPAKRGAKPPIERGHWLFVHDQNLLVLSEGGGVRLPQLFETSLGLLAEPVEVGRVGKRQRPRRRVLALFGHETPSFLGEGASPLMAPGVRVRGEEVKVM